MPPWAEVQSGPWARDERTLVLPEMTFGPRPAAEPGRRLVASVPEVERSPVPKTRAHPGHQVAAGRLPMLAGAAVALLAGMLGGVALLIVQVPSPAACMGQHGPLMVLGFLGTLIAVGRAVARRRRWGYGAPALSGRGAVALAAGAEWAGQVARTAAGGWRVGVCVALLGGRVGRGTLMQRGGAPSWFGGGLLWLAGR